MRTATQPGPALEPRRLMVEAKSAGDPLIHLAPGDDLLFGLRDRLIAAGIRHAAVEWLGGSLERIDYLTGMVDPTAARVATYGAPTRLEGPVTLISGTAILGEDAEGAPIVHCHAVLADAEGRLHGGHIPPGAARVGAEGAVGLAATHRGALFRVKYDPETNYPIFQPAEQPAEHPESAGAAA